jgi:hypothetical protein
MTGMPEYNYPAFMRAEADLQVMGYEVANPARVDELFPIVCGHTTKVDGCEDCLSRNWTWYMRKTIAMMLDCDGVALLDRWHASRGAKIEVQLADALDMPVEFVRGWIMKGKS